MTDHGARTPGQGGLKVIGAGFGRTGTLSVKIALEELGFYPCYHMVELLEKPERVKEWDAIARGEPEDWYQVFEGYQATVDWPACPFYKELLQAYPDARVLLNVRDPRAWYESISHTIYPIALTNPHDPIARLASALVWQGTFHGRFEEKEYAIAVFQKHIEEVKQHVPPEKLLVYDVKEGWGPLCTFLGVEVPQNKPFPRLNNRTNFSGSVEETKNSLIRENVSSGRLRQAPY